MSQVKVTIYEAKETVINVEYPICFRSKDTNVQSRNYYRFTDYNHYCCVVPSINSIITTSNGFETIESAYRNMVPIQDEIFESVLTQTIESVEALYNTIKAQIDAQYDTEAQKEADQEKREADAWDNHRNH